jgi:hypothetical protein
MVLFLVLGVGILLLLAPIAHAEESAASEGRYFIYSSNGLVQGLFSAHRAFLHGFTADLTSGELWTLRNIFHLSQAPVQRVSVAPGSGEAPPWNTVLIRTTIASNAEGGPLSIALVGTGVSDEVPVSECVDFTREGRVEGTCEDRHGNGTMSAQRAYSESEVLPMLESSRELFIYKACDAKGECWEDDIVDALSFAAAKEADVILLAADPRTYSSFLASELSRAVSSYGIVYTRELP